MKTLYLLLFLVSVFLFSGCGGGIGPGPTPNPSPNLPRGYADVLLPPLAGGAGRGFLTRGFNTFPVSVAFLPSSQHTPAAEQDARAGFDKWVAATNQGIRFDYRTVTQSPVGARVVVEFKLREEIQNFEGFTSPQNGYTLIQVAVNNAFGGYKPRPIFTRICAHEMGHALGINGHSPNPADIMSIIDGPPDVTQADVDTVRLAYGGVFPSF